MKSFKQFVEEIDRENPLQFIVAEGKTVFDYLLFAPEGEELEIATKISKMKSNSKYVYRGMSMPEYKALKKEKVVVSNGEGNTRGGDSPYVSDDLQLAGRFAIRAWKDYKSGGVLVTFERSKLPDLRPADPSNYRLDYLTADAIKDVYILGK